MQFKGPHRKPREQKQDDSDDDEKVCRRKADDNNEHHNGCKVGHIHRKEEGHFLVYEVDVAAEPETSEEGTSGPCKSVEKTATRKVGISTR